MLTHWKNDCAPEPPFYAVIFISQKTDDMEGYSEMDQFLMEEAQKQPGFLGYSSTTRPEGGIFISYWKDHQAIDKWRKHATHQKAKGLAFPKWYRYLHSMITKVESSKIVGEELAGGSDDL